MTENKSERNIEISVQNVPSDFEFLSPIEIEEVDGGMPLLGGSWGAFWRGLGYVGAGGAVGYAAHEMI